MYVYSSNNSSFLCKTILVKNSIFYYSRHCTLCVLYSEYICMFSLLKFFDLFQEEKRLMFLCACLFVKYLVWFRTKTVKLYMAIITRYMVHIWYYTPAWPCECNNRFIRTKPEGHRPEGVTRINLLLHKQGCNNEFISGWSHTYMDTYEHIRSISTWSIVVPLW